MSKPIPTSKRSIKKRITAGLKKAFPTMTVQVRRINGQWLFDISESYFTSMWQGRVWPKGRPWYNSQVQAVHPNDVVHEMIELDRKHPINGEYPRG